jgi:hypothetical protein
LVVVGVDVGTGVTVGVIVGAGVWVSGDVGKLGWVGGESTDLADVVKGAGTAALDVDSREGTRVPKDCTSAMAVAPQGWSVASRSTATVAKAAATSSRVQAVCPILIAKKSTTTNQAQPLLLGILLTPSIGIGLPLLDLSLN